ncbi:hypothetical protein E3P92_02619 [Wallemia ichthyophaga]|uniref:SET domain-containing protein n=1 Tax=Wallemia ichthyophaga (strain EXF-994 / CBS 113033) TaxID=1299270 RepID=R9AB43_WALI9|nr:uncharacterized protein J056_001771 [Wallemia ichthyophaga EXF-994]EOQ99448.1 hypothetical protein J056_001771 [Wallemia ichthyophaga EXF-994]TIB12248.1 hypothetical protein E3P92_02619 [Wallemia ichthyophaga]TIB32837.1 hypothetical protein E3P84_02405 [Wallemia ichthyophaga]TIB41052.1 hypothetical protein E3P83_02358 [Wallemia ichthyophaga]
MDDLLKSLNALGVDPPTDSQIPDLLNPEEHATLAKVLAGSADDLIQGAVLSLLENYLRSLKKIEDDHNKSINAPVKNVKIVPRKALLIRGAKERERVLRDREAGVGFIRQSQVFDNNVIPASKTPIEDLEYMQLKDLQFPHRHSGKFVIVRVISNPNTLFDLHAIVDDKEGNGIPLTLSHYTPSPTAPSDAILPYGSTLLIKEPYVTKNGIFVPAKSDTRLLSDSDNLINDVQWFYPLEQPSDNKEVDQLMAQANNDDNDLWDIIHDLNQVLSVNPLSYEAKIRLSDVYFGVHKLGSAYRTSAEALKLARDNQQKSRAFLNQARAAYDMRLFKEAENLIKGVQDPELQGEVRRVNELIKKRRLERDEGEFDVTELFKEKQRYIAPRLDVADYIGPIEVKDIDGRGRGVLATQDVEPGTLMLVGKAVGTAYPSDADRRNSKEHTTIMELNYSHKTLHGTAQVLARTRISHAIEDMPFLAKRVLGLCGSPTEPLLTEYLREGFPLTVDEDEAVEMLDKEGKLPVIDVDPRRVGSVLKYNAFGHASIAGAETPCMLHSLPAIINHSCVPNVASIHLGDVIMSRALTPLRKGQELLHSYVPGTGGGSSVPPSQQERRGELRKHGFTCQCELCSLDDIDGEEKLKERGLMLADVWPRLADRARVLERAKTEDEKFNAELDRLLKELEEFVASLESTFSDKRPYELKPELAIVRRTLAQLTSRRDVQKAIENELLSLSGLGAILNETHDKSSDRKKFKQLPRLQPDSAILSMLDIVELLKGVDEEGSKSWFESTKWAHDVLVGGGEAGFYARINQ